MLVATAAAVVVVVPAMAAGPSGFCGRFLAGFKHGPVPAARQRRATEPISRYRLRTFCADTTSATIITGRCAPTCAHPARWWWWWCPSVLLLSENRMSLQIRYYLALLRLLQPHSGTLSFLASRLSLFGVGWLVESCLCFATAKLVSSCEKIFVQGCYLIL